jgi:hypothetical protein
MSDEFQEYPRMLTTMVDGRCVPIVWRGTFEPVTFSDQAGREVIRREVRSTSRSSYPSVAAGGRILAFQLVDYGCRWIARKQMSKNNWLDEVPGAVKVAGRHRAPQRFNSGNPLPHQGSHTQGNPHQGPTRYKHEEVSKALASTDRDPLLKGRHGGDYDRNH